MKKLTVLNEADIYTLTSYLIDLEKLPNEVYFNRADIEEVKNISRRMANLLGIDWTAY